MNLLNYHSNKCLALAEGDPMGRVMIVSKRQARTLRPYCTRPSKDGNVLN